MWIVFECPSCHGQNVAEVTGETTALRCSACAWQRPVTEENRAASEPANCVVCGCGDLWRQKDFPQRLCEATGCRGLVYSRPGYGRSTPREADEVWVAMELIDGVDLRDFALDHLRARISLVSQDTYLFNDPYDGGTHLNDFRLVRPLMRGGRVFA